MKTLIVMILESPFKLIELEISVDFGYFQPFNLNIIANSSSINDVTNYLIII